MSEGASNHASPPRSRRAVEAVFMSVPDTWRGVITPVTHAAAAVLPVSHVGPAKRKPAGEGAGRGVRTEAGAFAVGYATPSR